ncbi:Hypothetical Protein RSKD131_2877 [Cereibacter sphaeroides KD131]|nr:Hypothetical Protein RSKD131_2877 [Cereibacter sphaeroides KD131]
MGHVSAKWGTRSGARVDGQPSPIAARPPRPPSRGSGPSGGSTGFGPRCIGG